MIPINLMRLKCKFMDLYCLFCLFFFLPHNPILDHLGNHPWYTNSTAQPESRTNPHNNPWNWHVEHQIGQNSKVKTKNIELQFGKVTPHNVSPSQYAIFTHLQQCKKLKKIKVAHLTKLYHKRYENTLIETRTPLKAYVIIESLIISIVMRWCHYSGCYGDSLFAKCASMPARDQESIPSPPLPHKDPPRQPPVGGYRDSCFSVLAAPKWVPCV